MQQMSKLSSTKLLSPFFLTEVLAGNGTVFPFCWFCRTLFTGAVGSVMLLYFHWQSVFYFVGLLAIAWGFLVRWYIRKHRKKTVYMLHNGREEEKRIKTVKEEEDGSMQGTGHFPWRKLLTKKPFW